LRCFQGTITMVVEGCLMVIIDSAVDDESWMLPLVVQSQREVSRRPRCYLSTDLGKPPPQLERQQRESFLAEDNVHQID